MCGIAGVFGLGDPQKRQRLMEACCNIQKHRGPDEEGIYISQRFPAALGHRRLSIIDLAGGKQPMSNEAGDIHIVFNGEIYNFLELRRELELKGHRFRTNSDTESILHLYEEYGSRCVEHLKGMFALGILDERQGALFLARDRLGKKPLSYFFDGEKFIFASEQKAILEEPSLERRVDEEALGFYLCFLYTPPERSIFRGIRKLLPGEWLYFKGGRVTKGRYWQAFYQPQIRHEDEYCLEIFERLSRAVQRRLISDVPLGAFLSGGIDSTIVVGLMSLLSREKVKTFSIGFEEQEFSELGYARETARHFGTDHHEFIVKADAVEVLPKLVWHYDEPFGDSSAIPTYYVSKVTREYVKVALSGDGGDEQFLGYPRHLILKIFCKGGRVLPPVLLGILGEFGKLLPGRFGRKIERLKDMMGNLKKGALAIYTEMMSTFTERYRRELGILSRDVERLCGEFLREYFDPPSNRDPAGAGGFADLRSYLPYDILAKVDIASMANSLEVRCPFLDHEFVELSLKIPTWMKLRGFTTKYILKKAFRGMLPEKIFYRGKMGFGVPLAKWLRVDLKEMVEDTLLSKSASQRGYFNHKTIQRLCQEHFSGRFDHSNRLWVLLWFELWHRIFIDRTLYL